MTEKNMRGNNNMTQALEQMLENTFVPKIAQDRMYQTIDTYASGTTQSYNFNPPKPFKPIIQPTPTGFVVPHPPIPGLPDIRDYHDTYKIDRYYNPYGGHTTFDIPGFPKKRIDHENDW